MRSVLSDAGLKLVAICLATLLWGSVSYLENPVQAKLYQVPLQHPNLPTNTVILGHLPTIQVQAIATADTLRVFNPQTLTATADFSHAHPGTNAVPIAVVNADRAVQMTYSPHVVTVRLDESITTQLQVTIQSVHALPAGFHEVSASVTPTQVTVVGPKSLLALGASAIVQVDLSGRLSPAELPADVVLLDANNRKIEAATASPATVTVALDIEGVTMTQTKTVGFTLVGQPANGYRVTGVQLTPLTVSATGQPSALASVQQISIDPIDITNARSDVVRTSSIRVPVGLVITPKTVSIHVFIGPIPGVSPSTSP